MIDSLIMTTAFHSSFSVVLSAAG